MGTDNGNLYAFAEETGSVKWNLTIGVPIMATPATSVWDVAGVPFKLVGVGADNGKFYAVYADNGTIYWTSPFLGGSIQSSAAVRTHEKNCWWVGSMSGSVYNFPDLPYRINWNTSLSGSILSSIAASEQGYLFLATYKSPPGVGTIYCLDMFGSVKWKYDTSSIVTSSPAIADGVVFIGDKDGNIYAFGGQPQGIDAIAVWQNKKEEGGDWDIMYSIWDKNTSSWWTTSGVPAAKIATLKGYDQDPNIAFNRNNNHSIAVWAHNASEQSGFVFGYDIWFSQWVDPARIWAWTSPDAVASIQNNDYDPAIAFDSNGWAIAIWVHEYGNGTREIFYSLWNGTGWIGPAGLLGPSNFGRSALPEITFTTTNTSGGTTPHEAVAIWTDADRIMLYSVWNGSDWSLPARIPGSYSAPNVSGPLSVPAIYRNGISADHLGNATAVWATDDITGSIYYAIWNGNESRWVVNATSLDPQGARGIMPAIAYNQQNNATLTYANNTMDIWHVERVGGIWQPAAFAADSGSPIDKRPAIAYLSNRKALTVWWSQNITPSEVYYAQWNGISWSSATPIKIDAEQDINPAIATIYGSPSSPMIIHDIAVTDIKLEKTVAGQGCECKIHVTVKNKGDRTETFNVSVYADVNSTSSHTITLTSGNSNIVSFVCKTSGFAYGNYTISAYAEPAPDEADTTDNTLIDGWVFITIPGDINADQRVNILDCIILANHFGHANGNGHTPDTKEWKNCMNTDINLSLIHISEPTRPY